MSTSIHTSIESITQIPGICAAHYTDKEHGTGCTVICCPEGATIGVDVRGGAPASRETDLCRPEETVQQAHAVVLSGGSAYGLAASCGVAEELERAGIGLDVGIGVVPIVCSACLFDLGCGDAHVRPDACAGALACAEALKGSTQPLARGNVGAGTGCTVGKIAGPERAMKAGLGEAVMQVGELVCGAVACVNACGDVVDPTSGTPIAGVRDSSQSSQLVSSCDLLLTSHVTMPLERTNTTISCIVTNAALTKAQALKVAQMSSDAYAHAIRPTHTTNDGDSIFVLATGATEAPLDVVGVLATSALEGAIVDGALSATSAFGYPAARDLAPTVPQTCS